MKHLFVVDDDKEIRQLIRKYLENEGYRVTCFSNGESLVSEIGRLKPDLLVMDIMMPGMDGLELCKAIRKKYEVPIVFVSARDEEIDRIIGLEIGGDDYLTKPFSPRELTARIRNIFKRMDNTDSQSTHAGSLDIEGLLLDMETRRLSLNGSEIRMTGKELETLCFLMKNENIAVSRGQILEEVWGYDMDIEGRIVDDVIKRIRKKLKDAGASVVIATVWGFGYKIERK